MNDDKISLALLEYAKDITALQESTKSAHKRIDKTDRLTEAVHELARSNAAIASEVKSLAEKFDKAIERIEKGQQLQGERLGVVEREFQQIRQNEKEIADMSTKLDALRMEPGDKWKYMVLAIICGMVTAVLGGLGAAFFM